MRSRCFFIIPLCPQGMRVMQQNLKTLDDLQAKMDHLVSHSDELMQEMDNLKVREDGRRMRKEIFKWVRGMSGQGYAYFIYLVFMSCSIKPLQYKEPYMSDLKVKNNIIEEVRRKSDVQYVRFAMLEFLLWKLKIQKNARSHGNQENSIFYISNDCIVFSFMLSMPQGLYLCYEEITSIQKWSC